MMEIKPSSFTCKGNGLVNRLETPCGVSVAFNPRNSINDHPEVYQFKALWDTGATNSVITKKVVDKIGSTPTGFAKVFHVNGSCDVNTHFINIFLPNNVGIPLLKVTESELNGCDVLIGMDIIARGDFAISNSSGKTSFTFQIPSTRNFDFVHDEQVNNIQSPAQSQKTGRNTPCPCGSGKKYKHCCGKQ